MRFATADLYDAHADEVQVLAPILCHYGGRRVFAGPVATLKVYEDNQLVHALLAQPGEGRVIVIDGAASLRSAIIGDKLAQKALEQGYAGFVINGCVRDVTGCARLALGVMALAAIPVQPKKKGFGEAGLPVAFGCVKFTPGEWLYADEDGVLVCARQLA